uniref:HPP transmembrane region domain-containing protein n=1 Tax=Hemiselmis andersenii TaxID=464988 RepID=A0A6U5CRA7_HEMAN|mmetsp:Transcript_9979/g.24382  ORF Transcript_9979/g.24382 Transcript_9979/m.24382 type:complete len:171 (+) Transcript_9979:51-563(+)|eukprot:CAMPEP_0114146858 /NCGR_PEP_ID=MMETSP0043_2-20121206/20788_1 /TAXON_ID=464988 /ORGANISM="Hemiselmis andersenii, Strain CCMP644" /LENGTH=170 /DNA_ID=CAMNT_0001241339 /DNA_START=19 /DNA_END=531 /DNA_ORIENTATION=-
MGDFKIVFDVPDLIFSVGGSIVSFMILAWAHSQLAAHNITAMCPPLGAVAVLLFAAPAAVPSKPYNTAFGFLIGSAAAFAIYTAVGEGFLKEFGGTRALMVGAAIAGMKITNSVHPPSGAYAVLLADVPAIKALGWKYILFPGLSGALILLVCQFLVMQLKGAVSKQKKA